AAGALLEAVRDVLAPTDLPLALRRDIAQVAASKLLVNLNNGVGAATGLSVRDALRSEDARRCFSLCMTEGLRVLRAAGIRPSMVYGLPPALFAMALRLPNAIFL